MTINKLEFKRTEHLSGSTSRVHTSKLLIDFYSVVDVPSACHCLSLFIDRTEVLRQAPKK